jgi:hypothetical protein
MKILDKVFREEDIQSPIESDTQLLFEAGEFEKVEALKAATKDEYTSLFHGFDISAICFFPAVRSTNIGGCEVWSGSEAKPYKESISRRARQAGLQCSPKFLFNVKISLKMKCPDGPRLQPVAHQSVCNAGWSTSGLYRRSEN